MNALNHVTNSLSSHAAYTIASASPFTPPAPLCSNATMHLGGQPQKPAELSSSRQFLRDFHSSKLSVLPVPSQKMPQSTAMHVLQRDELLQPQYAWMADDMRHVVNEKVDKLWTLMLDEPRSASDRIEARNSLIDVRNSRVYILSCFEKKTSHLRRYALAPFGWASLTLYLDI
jgi:hypothetical protein